MSTKDDRCAYEGCEEPAIGWVGALGFCDNTEHIGNVMAAHLDVLKLIKEEFG